MKHKRNKKKKESTISFTMSFTHPFALLFLSSHNNSLMHSSQNFLYKNDRNPFHYPFFHIPHKVHIPPMKIGPLILIFTQILPT